MTTTRRTTKAVLAIAGMGLALISVKPAWAALCEESFNLQTATQYIYNSSSTSNLGNPDITPLATDLSNMHLLFDSTQYQIVSGFDGACGNFTQKPVRYRLRFKGQSTVTLATVNDYYVRMYDSNTVLTGQNYAFWFGFSLKPDTLVYAIGKGKGASDLFTAWFGVAIFLDSTRNPTSGLWSSSTSYQIQSSGPGDSLTLANGLVSGWKNITFDANRRGKFTVQLIKVTYDAATTSLHKPQVAAKPQRKPSALSVQQNEGQVRLRLNMPESELGLVELYDMFGHKVAALHPTGSDYLWNGQTVEGFPARAGVYFAQTRGKILGKFFLTR